MFAYLTWNPGPIRVLLVEDSLSDAMLVKDALNQSDGDFSVAHVDRLAHAVAHLAKKEVDVVVLDLGLPDSRGLDTLLSTRRAAPEVPVVVLTGINDEALSMNALEQGAQDYLVKDLTEGDLLVHSICHAIERHQLHSKLNQSWRRELENQKLESLAMLAGGIAHDFNDLLAVIRSKADVERRKVTTPPAVKKTLEQIQAATNQASDLCKQLLSYSGKGRRVLLLYDLNALVEEMAPVLRQTLAAGVTLERRLTKPLPRVLGDLTQFRQVVMNLVQNASEAIGGRDGVITISTSVVHADRKYLDRTILGGSLSEGDFVCLEVTDTGCGMGSLVQRRLFEPFSSTKHSGRGLGLAVVHGIVRAGHGTLEVMSEEGKGSTFSVLLPASNTSIAA